jgi:hypothetical protein
MGTYIKETGKVVGHREGPATYTPPKKKVVGQHDEAPSGVTDHAFVPRGAWYTLCRICGLAQAAHRETTVDARDHIWYGNDDD